MTGDLPTWAADWLDFFDMLSEGIMMPLGAMLMSLMIGWEIGPEVIKGRGASHVRPQPWAAYSFFKICVKFITPAVHDPDPVRPDQGVLLLNGT